jgi:hypothetical protein
MIAIVPNYVRDIINTKLDEAYAISPGAEIDRQIHYNALLSYFDDHGEIPDFTLSKN